MIASGTTCYGLLASLPFGAAEWYRDPHVFCTAMHACKKQVYAVLGM